MKFLAIYLFAILVCFGSSTDEKIKNQTVSLQSSQDLEKQLNKKLDDLAKDIFGGEENLKKVSAQISELVSQIATLEQDVGNANDELNKLNLQNSELIKNQKNIEQSLIRIISDEFALDLVMPKEYTEGMESIIATEILSKLNLVINDDFKNLAKIYENTSNMIKDQNSKIADIEMTLKSYKQKQAQLVALQDNHTKMLANLKRDKQIYQKQLLRLQAQQSEIRKTLEELKIVAKREVEEAKKLAEQKAAKNSKGKKDTQNATVSTKDGDVRQIGSSYQASLVKKYSGEKTIAPLDDFTVKQKFGNYIDPVYNIKIFNESVILSSQTSDAKVKSVLSGKVVFAKDTAMLNKVVIIENANGIHTIYAHLSQIAPTIKVGTKVQKGYVIGRVAKDLTFEVTQKNYHIDPLEMISLK